MLKLSCFLERGYVPVQLSQPLMQCRITRSDITNIALEMLHINWIEANDSSIKANVRFSDIGTKIVWSSMFSEMSFGAVESNEKGFHGLLISFLGSSSSQLMVENLMRNSKKSRDLRTSLRSKPRFVYAIIYIIVGPAVYLFNLISQFFW